MLSGTAKVVWEFIESIVFALAIFAIVYLFLFQPNQVKGKSMHPTFEDNEYILTDKVTFRMRSPKYNDIVVFKSPKNEEVDFIKRIIGTPGDKVRISGGKVYLNGEELLENYLPVSAFTPSGNFAREGVEVVVPDNQYFVLGDNRTGSSDSREWGFVKREEFIGKVFFRYFPFNRFGVTLEP
jgi:signal peptidase I